MSRGTPPRSLRIPPEVWAAALDKARDEGTTVTAVVVEALRKFAAR
jgi:predicted HicB family RNase H-like nuclease